MPWIAQRWLTKWQASRTSRFKMFENFHTPAREPVGIVILNDQGSTTRFTHSHRVALTCTPVVKPMIAPWGGETGTSDN
jgi:hypothetical protein